MKLAVVFVILCACFLSSCTKEKSKVIYYLNVDSIIHAEEGYLAKKRALLTKDAMLNDRSDSARTTPKDSTAWASELSIFSQLGAINRELYEVTDGLQDKTTNLHVRTYKVKDPLAMPYLNVYYQGTPDKIRMIEGVYIEENMLYKSSRLLRLELQPADSTSVITAYSVTGGQKMFLGDSVRFSIRGNILIPRQ